MKKTAKILLVTLFVVSVLAVPLTGCSKNDETTTQTQATQTLTVQTGDISTEITGAGNLDLAKIENVPVDIFWNGTATIGEVLVEEGDTVTEGQVLVRMDTDEWNDELQTLEDNVNTKERALISAQVSLLTAQETLASTANTSTKEKALLSAETALYNAQQNLNTAIASSDYASAWAALNKAKVYYNYVANLAQTTTDAGDYLLMMENAEEQLQVAQTDYDNALSGYNTEGVVSLKRALRVAEINLAAAQQDLADLPQAVAKQEMQVELAEGNVSDAEKALADARDKLAKAQAKSPELVAPFDGFVTAVKVESGDNEIGNGTIAVTVADPNEFEAQIYVGESDILNLTLDTEATVSVDAIPDVSFPAKVTWISPTATISSSVVNYAITVTLTSLKPIATATQTTGTTMPTGSSLPQDFTPPEGFAPPEGFSPPSDFTPPEGFTPPTGQSGIAQTQPATTTAIDTDKEYTLKEGMTAIVTLTLPLATDVLVIPSAAITTENGQSYVQVVSTGGATEKRAIQTGATDYTYTEVTSGLSEGEQILSQATTTTTVQSTATAATTNERQGGMMMIGGGPPP